MSSTMDKTEAPIIEISKNQVVFDKSSKYYKDTTKRRDIFQEIGEKIGLTGKSRLSLIGSL